VATWRKNEPAIETVHDPNCHCSARREFKKRSGGETAPSF